MAAKSRTIPIFFRVDPKERDIIEQKMKDVGTSNMGAYLRKMAIDGYVIRVEAPEFKELLRLLGTYSLEIYLLNVSLFSEVALLRALVPFGYTNRLYYLISYGANVALAVLLHRVVEGLKRLWSRARG